MQAYHLTMLGLVLDIVGAFLVSVEAIKMDNLRMLRDKVFNKAQRYLLSPRIIIVDEKGKPISGIPESRPSDSYPGLFMGLHYIAGLLVILFLNYVLNGMVFDIMITLAVLVSAQSWYVITLAIIASIFLVSLVDCGFLVS